MIGTRRTHRIIVCINLLSYLLMQPSTVSLFRQRFARGRTNGRESLLHFPTRHRHTGQSQGGGIHMVATWETTALIEQDLAHMLHPVTNLHRHAQEGPLILTEGKGSILW